MLGHGQDGRDTIMKRGTKTHQKIGPAWKAAEAYGFDMSLVEANLQRTVAQRIEDFERARAMALELWEAMRKKLG